MMNDIIELVQSVSEAWQISPDDVILLQGSIVEGFGNSHSDIDVFVIAEDPDVVSSLPSFSWHDNRVINTSAYTYEHANLLVSGLNSIALDDLAAIKEVPPGHLDRYYRLCNGISVAHHDAAKRFLSAFDKEHIASIIAIWSAIQASEFLIQAEDFLRDNRHDLATLCAQYGVAAAIDSFLASHDEAYPNMKWRFEKLARRFGPSSQWYQKAWSLKSRGLKDTELYCSQCTLFCKEMGIVEIPRSGPKIKHAQNTEAAVVGSQNFISQNKAFLYELNDNAKFVWDQIDGVRSIEDITEATASTFGLSTRRANGYVLSFVEELRGLGLLV